MSKTKPKSKPKATARTGETIYVILLKKLAVCLVETLLEVVVLSPSKDWKTYVRILVSRIKDAIAKVETGKAKSVQLHETTAVKVWDALNEAALNVPSKTLAAKVKKIQKDFESALEKAGLGIPKSSHGHA